MKSIKPERAVYRITSAKSSLYSYQKKIWEMRKIVAGDQSVLTGVDISSTDDGQDAYYGGFPEWHDVVLTDVVSGRSNRILQHVRTLAMQTIYRFPDVEFEDLEPEIAAVNAQYLKYRLGPIPHGCNAKDHMRLALIDYLVGGPGWVFVGASEGKPVVRWCDSLRMFWDPTARQLSDCQWAAVEYTNTLEYWSRVYGPSKFKHLVHDKESENVLDRPVTLMHYYDTDGNFMVFLVKDGEIDEKPIFKGENQYIVNDVYVLPFESVSFMTLPSVRLPIGLVEQMLPNQIALWEAEKRMRDDISSGRGFKEFEEGSYSDEQIEKWERGDTDYLVRRSGSQPMHTHPPTPPDGAVINWAQLQDKQMIAMSGADPYAAGSPVEGVQYAAEVNAIKSSSSLMAGNIAKDNAEFWQRVVKKVLAFGKLFDRNKMNLVIGDYRLEFNDEYPISQFLEPDAPITVREDSTTFKPKEMAVNEALMLLDASMKVAGMFPGAMAKAFEKFLRAIGERNVSEWMEAPKTPEMMQDVSTENTL